MYLAELGLSYGAQDLRCYVCTLSCGMHMGSSSLTGDPTQAALLWESRVLTGPLGKSQQVVFLRAHFPQIPAFRSPSYQGLF